VVNTAPGAFVQNCTCYKQIDFYPDDEVVSSFYVRMHVDDVPGVLAQITPILAAEGVSVRSVLQSGREDAAELVFVLHPAREAAVNASLARIAALDCVRGAPTVFGVDGEVGR